MTTRYHREYRPEELALFAGFQEHRAVLRPKQCHAEEGGLCWVREGPPAYNTNGPRGECRGCHAAIVMYSRNGKA